MGARLQAKLNQVVCTLEGMTTLLQRTPGDFAVVVHGDADCAAVLMHGMDHPGAQRFFCTGLTPDEAVAGRTLPVLQDCLEAVCQEVAPEEIFVLGTCLSALVGDEVERVTRVVADACDTRVTPLQGAGMRFVSQAAVVDRFARLLSQGAPERRRDVRAVNLLGFDPGTEVRAMLEALGVTVNAVLDIGAPVHRWQRVGAASWNLALDAALFAGFLSDWQARGVLPLQVDYPVGAAATDRFFEQVLGAVGPAVDVDRVLAGPRRAARAAVAQACERTRGRRLGYNIGSKKNLSPRTLALEGLAELRLFEELDFDITLLVQGDDAPERRAAVRETLTGLGCDAPLAFFSDTVYFAETCRAHDLMLTYASDHLRPMAVGAGLGFVVQSTLRPGYAAVAENLERILAAVATLEEAS